MQLADGWVQVRLMHRTTLTIRIDWYISSDGGGQRGNLSSSVLPSPVEVCPMECQSSWTSGWCHLPWKRPETMPFGVSFSSGCRSGEKIQRIPGTLTFMGHHGIYQQLCQTLFCLAGPEALKEVSGYRAARSLRLCWRAAHLDSGPMWWQLRQNKKSKH